MPKSNPRFPQTSGEINARKKAEEATGEKDSWYVKLSKALFTRPKGENVYWPVKVFLLIHIIAIVSWVMPEPGKAVANGTLKGSFSERLMKFNQDWVKKSPTQLYLLSTGLWQSWDMFAPNPANTDMYPDADVTLKSGKVLHYDYPRMYSLSRLQKYQKERYRKFFENASDIKSAYLFPVFARAVVNIIAKDPNDPPVKVELKRHQVQVPKVESFGTYSQNLWNAILDRSVTPSVLMPPNPPMPEKYTEIDYYTYYPQTGEGQVH